MPARAQASRDRTSRHSPRQVAGLLAALSLAASGALAAAGPLHAVTPPGPTHVADAQVDALALAYRPDAIALETRAVSMPGGLVTIDPETTVIDAPGGTAAITLDTTLLPAGALVDDEVTLAITAATGPGTLAITGQRYDAVRLTAAGTTTSSATLPVADRTPTTWTFGEPGDYTLTFTAFGARADDEGTGSGRLVGGPYTLNFQVGQVAPESGPSVSPELGPSPSAAAAPTVEASLDPSRTFEHPAPTTDPTVEPSGKPTSPQDSAQPEVDEIQAVPLQAPPTSPLPAPDTSALTEAARGDVTLSHDPAAPGQLLTVTVPPQLRGQWVSAWVLSTPTDLGWKQVNAVGAVTVALPESLELGNHRVVVRDAAADLVGWLPLQVTDTANAAEQCVATEVTETVVPDVVTSGHFDFGPVLEGATMRALVKDDRTSPVRWVDPAGLVFHLSDAAAVQAPGGDFAFLGSGQVWQIPLTQSPGVPWLGWNTQHPTVAGHVDGTVTLTLENLDGPGRLAVYSLDSFGRLGTKHFGTADGFGRSTTVEVGGSGVHVHAVWAFSEPGSYHARLTFAGTVDGTRRSATSTLTFFVGPGDPASAAEPVTTTSVVGRTPDGQECELPASAGGTGGTPSGGVLPHTGADRDAVVDTASLAVTFLVVGLALLGAAALAPRTPRTGTRYA